MFMPGKPLACACVTGYLAKNTCAISQPMDSPGRHHSSKLSRATLKHRHERHMCWRAAAHGARPAGERGVGLGCS